MPLISSLRQRPFALLWTGQSISRLGDALYQIALILWVAQHLRSPAALGVIFACAFTPLAIFVLLGGVIGDRVSRLHLMLGSDSVRGLVVLLIAALAMTNHLGVWYLAAASVVFGSVDAFFQPAYAAMLPDTTTPTALASANALTTLSAQLAELLGPPLGALLAQAAGPSAIFALDGLSFFISAACLIPLARMQTPTTPVTSTTTRLPLLRDLRAGFHYVRSSPWLWIGIALSVVFSVSNGAPYYVALPFLVHADQRGAGFSLGLVYALGTLGAILGALLLGLIATKLRRRGIAMYGCWVLGGLARLTFGLPLGMLGLLGVALFDGAVSTVGNLIWTQTVQEVTPRAMLARVSSIDLVSSRIVYPLGYVGVGLATAQFGAPLIFIVSGFVTALVCLLGIAHPAIRRFA